MARSCAGMSSSINPVMNLHQPKWEYAWAQLRLSEITVWYSTMAPSYRCWPRRTWPLAKRASALRGDATEARSANFSARAISAAAVSVIESRARAASSMANQLCAATEFWSSANARSTTEPAPHGSRAMAALIARHVRAK